MGEGETGPVRGGMAAVGGPVPPAVHEPAAAVRWLGKPGPAYPGRFHSQGASAPLGGGPGLGPFPDSGKEASPEGEYRNLRGVEPRRKGEGQKGPRGRGLPAGIPEAQPAAPGLKGGWVATKRPQPRRPRPICGGAARPHRVSHSRPQAGKWGAVPGEAPGTATGETGAKPHGLLREESGAAAKGARGPSGRGISGPQGCPYPEGPTLIPPPTGGGFRRYAGRPWRARRRASRP